MLITLLFSFVGYATGGGKGDTTPWVGLGVDDVLSYDIVLYDGTNVTASATENEDLYWALRGGGSGFGVITSIETAVISASEEASNFTWVSASYKQTQNEAREFLKRFQDFLMPDLPISSKEYKEKIRATSAKFGGTASYNTNIRGSLGFSGLYLGSEDEANSTFAEAGLLDSEILDGFDSIEFSSWADAQSFIICNTLGGGPGGYYWVSWVKPGSWWFDDADPIYKLKVDICEDLGIHSTNCYQVDWGNIPKCDPFRFDADSGDPDFDEDALKNEILPALKDVAKHPQSWLNRPGGNPLPMIPSYSGGLLHGRVDPDVLLEMANEGIDFIDTLHGKHRAKMEKSFDSLSRVFSQAVILIFPTRHRCYCLRNSISIPSRAESIIRRSNFGRAR